MREQFIFFKNFKDTADRLPDDMRLKFYDALTDYIFNGSETEDFIIAALVNAIKPSLDRDDKRGGCHNLNGKNQYSKINGLGQNEVKTEVKRGQNEVKTGGQKVVKSGQSGQSGQSFLEVRSKKEEVRSMKYETEDILSSQNKFCSDKIDSADAPNKYAFFGKIIRLKQKDFDAWTRAYPNLNLYAELLQRDLWLSNQPEKDQKNWFCSTASFFIKQDERRKRQNAQLDEAEEYETFEEYLERALPKREAAQ